MQLFIAKYSQEMILLKNNNYKPNEFEELINVSVRALQRWYVEGKLKGFELLQIEDITLMNNIFIKVFIKKKNWFKISYQSFIFLVIAYMV